MDIQIVIQAMDCLCSPPNIHRIYGFNCWPTETSQISASLLYFLHIVAFPPPLHGTSITLSLLNLLRIFSHLNFSISRWWVETAPPFSLMISGVSESRGRPGWRSGGKMSFLVLIFDSFTSIDLARTRDSARLNFDLLSVWNQDKFN